jgi:hypothetical protein
LAYFFPAFRWYGPQLFFHLTYGGQSKRFIPHFGREQKDAVVALLRHIGETRQSLVAGYMRAHELQTAIERWFG